MPGWPQWGQNIVRAIIGTETGPVGPDNPLPVAQVAGDGAAALGTYFNNALSNTVQPVMTGAAKLSTLEASNPNTSDVFLQVFDLPSGSVTLGTTVPKQSFVIPAGQASTARGGMDKLFDPPIGFDTALSIAATTTPTGNTAPTSPVTVNMGLK